MAMGKILGIIGGGQLGMMITEAAKKMPEHISKVIVLDPVKNCSASQVGAEQIIADFKDKNAIIELAKRSDIITYEIESGDSEVLKLVEKDAEINPSPETLKIIQDKFLQKSFLMQNNIPVPEFIPVESISNLEQGLRKFGYPSLLKARRDAYDGRGNFKIDSSKQIQKAFDYFNEKNLMLEKFVPFKMEVSVIAPRVHNSGHHTLQSSETSQFEQHLRAILGLELGDTSLLHPTIMYNILGPKNFEGEYKPIILSEQNVFLKMYGKKISKPSRKLGHFNLVAKQGETIDHLLKKLESLKDKVSINPA